jgi:putative ABC transport system substrate-binding protein
LKKTFGGLTFGALLFAVFGVGEAQQTANVPRIGWLFVRSAEGSYGRDLSRRAFRDLGYMEGKNITFEYRYADNRLDRVPALADELVRLKVNVILAASANAARAAMEATKTIPVVFVSTSDPVVAGLIDSLRRPGGNLTGFTTIAPMLAGKRLELLRETIPSATRIALLWNPKNPPLCRNGKKANFRPENSACSFILWN